MKLANRQPTRIAIDALDIQPGDDVLDLGCGAGQAMAIMVPLAKGGTVHGLDQSEVMVREAQHTNRAAARAGHLTVRSGRFETLPYPDASFDKILASNIMYFWHETRPVIREIRRVLKPGGRLSIYLTDASTMARWKIAEAGTHRLFTLQNVAAALKDGGFGAEEAQVTPVSLAGNVTGLLAVATRGCG